MSPARRRRSGRDSEHGSALVLALLVAFVLGLLGITFVLMAHQETQISTNERLAAQARFAAEAGARSVRAWFDRPGTALGFPIDPVVTIRARAIIAEDPASGTGPHPEYKVGQDENSDGVDDLFRVPYRGEPVDTFLGQEGAPDLSIQDTVFLDQLSETLFGDYPDPRRILRARITRIDVYAPPYVQIASAWTRHGVATVKVTAGIYRHFAGSPTRLMAQRTVRSVIHQTPYTTPVYGPVHVCGDLELEGSLRARWGVVTATGSVRALPDFAAFDVPPSLPRAVPAGPRIDRLWTSDPVEIVNFNSNVDSGDPMDPWLRLISRGPLEGSGTSNTQPFGAPGPWVAPDCCDQSNVMQNHDLVGCPEYAYAFWKRLATSGAPGSRYFVWVSGDEFSEQGTGPARTFEQIFTEAAGREGLFFFDTQDGRAPRDDDADGIFDNLTPAITITADWAARGFVYLNTEELNADSLNVNLPVSFRAPAEPYVGDYAAWIDVEWATTVFGDATPGGAAGWEESGVPVAGSASFHGILYTSGRFRASGGGVFYGSVIARSGALLDGATSPETYYFWDAEIGKEWPPDGWNLPRVYVSGLRVGF